MSNTWKIWKILRSPSVTHLVKLLFLHLQQLVSKPHQNGMLFLYCFLWNNLQTSVCFVRPTHILLAQIIVLPKIIPGQNVWGDDKLNNTYMCKYNGQLEAQMGRRDIALPCLTSVLGNGWWSTLCSGQFTPAKQTCYPLTRRMDSPRASLDGCGKNLSIPPTWFWTQNLPSP